MYQDKTTEEVMLQDPPKSEISKNSIDRAIILDNNDSKAMRSHHFRSSMNFSNTSVSFLGYTITDSNSIIRSKVRVRAIMVFMVLSAFSTATQYTLFAPFMPLEMDKKGYDPSNMGLIMSIYSLTQLFCSLGYASIVARCSLRSLYLVSLVNVCASMVLYSLLMRMSLTESQFLGLSLALRVFQGFNACNTWNISYSIVLKNFSEADQHIAMPLIQVAMSGGTLAGPVMGGYFYRKYGYEMPFLIMSAVFFVLAILVKILLPKQIDKKVVKEEEDVHMEEDLVKPQEKERHPFIQLISVPTIVAPLICYVVAQIQYVYFEPILAVRLQDYYKVSLYTNNMFFAIEPVFFLTGSLVFFIIVNFLKIKMKMKLFVIFCNIALFWFVLMCGPSPWFFEDDLTVMGVGIGGVGFFAAMSMVPLLPEVFAETIKKFGTKKADALADSSGALFNFCFSLGAMLGPLVGQIGLNTVGYAETAEIVALITLFNIIFYLWLGEGCKDLVNLVHKKKEDDDAFQKQEQEDED